MAGQDKTEEPTGKRLAEARRRGQVAVSRELLTAVGLLATFGLLAVAGGWMLERYQAILRDGLRHLNQAPDSTEGVFAVMAHLTLQALPLVALPAAVVGGLSILLTLLQTRFNFAREALKPDFKKLNPIAGLKRLLGYRGLFEVAKEFLKVAVILATALWVLWPQRDDLAQLVGLPAPLILQKVGALGLQLGLTVAAVYLALAAADFFFQRYSTKRELRMTREEVKQESRQSDMPPEIKGAIKRRQMEAFRKRMLAQVPEADVVITNPTHYAVALAYQPGAAAPQVLASGVDLIALDIRERASESGVEIVENPPLARALYAMCQPGDWVPAELYVAVAEVLAYVYRRRERRDISYQA